jgi:hypothetical protein
MFPEANPLKGVHMKPISRYVKPDVISCNEMIGQQAIDTLLSQGLDTSIYAAATYIYDFTIGNALFYNKHRIGYSKSRFLNTQPRKTCIYYLYFNNQDFTQYPDTVFFTVYVAHFKSSQGSDNEAQRAIQTAAIRTDLSNRPNVFNTFMNGDFNVYSSNELAYQNLLAPGIGQFLDPINRPGNWSNNTAFKDIHTQSPRTTSFESGVTGGLDDRFDFILSTEDILTGTHGLRILTETYQAFGNDGLHYNQAIISLPTNTSAPDSVIQALHNLSDHLPVIVDIEVDPSNAYNGISSYNETSPCQDWAQIQQNLSELSNWKIWDFSGRLIQQKTTSIPIQLTTGFYIIEIHKIGQKPCYQKISVN